MPNFVRIARTAAEILRFFDFSRWRPKPVYAPLDRGMMWWCVMIKNFVADFFDRSWILLEKIGKSGFLSSVGWDLLCSTHILSLKCLPLPATKKWRATPNVQIFVLSHDLGDLGVTHRVHLWLDGKRVIDFLLPIIEFLASSQGCSTIKRNLSKSAFSDGGGSLWVQTSGKGSSTNDTWRRKARVPALSRGVVCVILRLAVFSWYNIGVWQTGKFEFFNLSL